MDQKRLPKEVEAWRQLLLCQSRIVRRVDRELLQQNRVPLTFYDVLLNLRYAPNQQLRFRDLNGQIVLTRSALSRCIDKMNAAGLVDKLECPEDPRGLVIRLTSRGLNASRAAWPIYREQITKLFGRHFAIDELEALISRFSSINQQLPD